MYNCRSQAKVHSRNFKIERIEEIKKKKKISGQFSKKLNIFEGA